MNNLNFSDYKFKIIENIDDEDLLGMFATDNVVYVKPGVYAMSTRKLEALIRIAYIQKYYQCNPVRFIDNFFNIELLDAQAYIVQRTWNCPNVLVLASRGFGKSTVIDLILMAKDMLFATLDTSSRKIDAYGKSFILSDTVGFVSSLPHHLVKAFKSTLDEVRNADLLLHVIDITSPNYLREKEVTETTLKDILTLVSCY